VPLLSEEENAVRIKQEVQYLSGISLSIEKYPESSQYYPAFWTQVKIINCLFKELKPISYKDRQLLWNEFSSLCDEIKKIQQTLYRNNASRLENEISSLSSIRDAIRNTTLERYRNYSQFWENVPRLSDLFKRLKPLSPQDREILWKKFSELCEDVKNEQISYRKNFERSSQERYNTIMDLLRYSVPHSSNVDELKDHGRYLKQSRELLSEYKNDMTFTHKKKCFEEIQEVQRQMDAWWETVKSDRQKRHADFQASVRANLEKNIERHRKATNSLEYLREKVDELQSKIDSAWNDDWASKASGWMSEFEDKIRDTEDYIRKIEGWIEEDEQKLR